MELNKDGQKNQAAKQRKYPTSCNFFHAPGQALLQSGKFRDIIDMKTKMRRLTGAPTPASLHR